MQKTLDVMFADLCYTCPDRETVVDEDKIRDGNLKVVATRTAVYCAHQKVCAKYLGYLKE